MTWAFLESAYSSRKSDILLICKSSQMQYISQVVIWPEFMSGLFFLVILLICQVVVCSRIDIFVHQRLPQGLQNLPLVVIEVSVHSVDAAVLHHPQLTACLRDQASVVAHDDNSWETRRKLALIKSIQIRNDWLIPVTTAEYRSLKVSIMIDKHCIRNFLDMASSQ